MANSGRKTSNASRTVSASSTSARAKGMRFGLWFGSDSSDDAANWERDAACLLDYHRRLGIDYFKMDSMKLLSPRGPESVVAVFAQKELRYNKV